MNSFSYETIETRVFNQPMSYEVCGYIDDDGEIILTELYAVSEGKDATVVLIPNHDMLNTPEIEKAIISLLNEWPHNLISKNRSKK